jgi:hypothetical protein
MMETFRSYIGIAARTGTNAMTRLHCSDCVEKLPRAAAVENPLLPIET